MRQNLLSFSIACCVIMALAFVTHFVRDEERGVAQASIGSEEGDAGHYSASKKRALRSKILDNPNALVDLKGEDIRHILQAPELVRSEFPTVIWQYRTEACVLDLYFTAKDHTISAAPVVHYEMRPRQVRGAEALNAEVCLGDIVQPVNFVSLLDVSAFYKSE